MTNDEAISSCVRDIIEISELLAPWAKAARLERERLAPLVEKLKRERSERDAGSRFHLPR